MLTTIVGKAADVSMDHGGNALPPLESLRAFEAAARLGSFSAAAEDLNVTHGAVSRRIAGLESWLRQRLFKRHSKGVSLTTDGDRLYERTKQAFELLSEGSDRWHDVRRGAVVRLTSLRAVCSRILIPQLGGIEAGEPRIRVDVVIDDARPLDMEEMALDLAVRVGAGVMSGRVSLKLYEEPCFPVANPRIAQELVDQGPATLLNYPLLHNRDTGVWRSWLQSFDIAYRPRPQDRRFSDYGLVIDAAAEGLGIAVGRPLLIARELESGRVVRIGKHVAPNPHPYWLDRPNAPIRSATAIVARRIAAIFKVSDQGLIEDFLASK